MVAGRRGSRPPPRGDGTAGGSRATRNCADFRALGAWGGRVSTTGRPARPPGQPLRGKRIALVVDHPQRDLPGLALLAFELCQRGAICHLVPLNIEEREVMSLVPDFGLLNYFRTFNYRLGTWMARAGIAFG